MAIYHFSALADETVLDFVPTADVLVFAERTISASQLEFGPTADGAGVTIRVAGKTIVLDNLTPYTLNSSAFSFADGSRVLSLTAQSQGSLTGGSGADLLIGSTAARPMTMVSVAASETVGSAFGGITHGSSADGRYVLFSASSDDVVGGDTNRQLDVFVRDTVTGTTTRVSLTADGTQLSSNGTVFGARSAAISDDGRVVAFSNYSDALGGLAGTFDSFVKNLETGAVTLVSSDASGNGANTTAILSSMSGTGRYVALSTTANNLGVTDNNAVNDVYLKDVLTGAVTRVSQNGSTEGNGASSNGQVTRDGRFVAFDSTATNLSFSDADSTSDVLLRDMNSNFSPNVVSVSSAGVKGDAASQVQAISDDGRYVLFSSSATNLVAGDTNGVRNLFLRDTQQGTTVAVDTSAAGVLGNASVASDGSDLSGDGRYAVFVSAAGNLADAASGQQAYVKDLLTGAVALLSLDSSGISSSTAFDARISADGSQVVFTASGDSLDPNVGGGGQQVYTVANPLLGVTLAGGAGNDSYLIARASDAIVEAAASGVDTVRASVSYTLATNVENLILTGSENLDATGNAGANVLGGNAGDNVLDGGTGNDTATYAQAGDAVTLSLELPGVAQDTGGDGIDTLISIENLTGSAFDDYLLGDAGDNVLDGGAGADVMIGGAGNDAYVFDRAADLAIEEAGGGVDTIRSNHSRSLEAEFENLVLTGTASINATGNGLNNVLAGNAGSNRLDGGAGTDAASYLYARAGVVVGLDRAGPQSTGAGIDTLVSIENLVGSNHDDVLHGNSGTNTLNGGNGIDTVSYARAASAVTVDLAITVNQATGGGGSDRLVSFENLTGSVNNDILRGNAGANVIDGGLGVDTMSGGSGNDTYIVNSSSDRVVEVASGGTDSVLASASYTLSAEVERITLTGTANINATGNALNNVIFGNGGANILNGGGGTDLVSYASASSGVAVNLATGIATGGGGSDTLLDVEYVTGSAFGDALVGSSGSNQLIGGEGADSLTGGAGQDAFVFTTRASADTITDFGSGIDKLRFSQASLRIGDGDTLIENATTAAGTGGFAVDAELVVITGNAASLSRADAAAVIGNATSFYQVGQTVLFAVDNGTDTGLYHFTSSSTNSTISAGELALVGTLQGVVDGALSDYVFVA